MSKSKVLVGPDTDIRLRTLLAAFLYCPSYFRPSSNISLMVCGLRARDLPHVAPVTFSRIWTRKERRGQQIAMCMRMLVHRGYVIEVRRVRAHWLTPKSNELKEYQSPVFQLTEQGFYWLVANCDLSLLPRGLPKPSASVTGDARNEERFVDFAGIDPWLTGVKRHGASRYTYDRGF